MAPLTPRLEDFPGDARRIALTISCADTAAIPKVAQAGELTTVKDQLVQIMHNGVVVEKDGYFGAWMTEIIRCLRGHHEPQEERVFDAVVKRLAATESDPSMIELGSFWAYYSLWFRRAMPRSIIVAVEPDPGFLEVGRRNFALNDEEAVFLQGAIGSGDARSWSFVAESDGQRYEVPRYDLASVMAAGGLERVSLLLADIQGAETALVEDAAQLLAGGGVRCLILSTHHHSISGCPTTHQDLLAMLRRLGAHVIAEHSVGESFSGDGLIAASFDQRDRDFTVETSRARARESLLGELEYDLASAWDRARRAEEERDLAKREASSAEESLRERLRLAEEDLARMRASRLWRWSARPRAVYSRFRKLLS